MVGSQLIRPRVLSAAGSYSDHQPYAMEKINKSCLCVQLHGNAANICQFGLANCVWTLLRLEQVLELRLWISCVRFVSCTLDSECKISGHLCTIFVLAMPDKCPLVHKLCACRWSWAWCHGKYSCSLRAGGSFVWSMKVIACKCSCCAKCTHSILTKIW